MKHRQTHRLSSNLIRATVLVVSLAALALTVPANAAPEPAWDDVVATIDGEKILRSEAEAMVRAELVELDSRRHSLMEAAVDRLVADRLLELEAADRGLPLDSVIAEIEAEVEAAPVTDADVDRWYQQNQARIRAPKAQVEGQIRTFLENEARAQIRAAKVAALSEKFGATVLLEPQRFDLGLDGAAAFGPDDAPVTLVEYGDFECPPCGRLHSDLKKLKAEYGDRVRFVFEHFPLESIHPNARAASRAAFCAGEQGEFWGMHDALFENQRSLNEATYLSHADALGLDRDAFAGCLSSDDADAAVTQDLADGRSVGVGSTPSLFVNGRPINLSGNPYASLKAELDKELSR